MAVGTPARADEESPSSREQRLCAELRDAGKFAEAVAHCRAAYDALPDDAGEPTLNSRSLIVFDIVHTYREGFEATGELAFLCGGEALMRDFAAYLDARGLSGVRSIDYEAAQRLGAEFAARRGDRSCDGPTREPADDDLLPVVARRPPAPSAPVPAPPPAPRNGLRIAGGVVLGAGVGLGLLVAGALVAGARIEAGRDRLTRMTEYYDVGPEGYALAERLDRVGIRANRIAIGGAMGAGAAVVASVILFAVDGQRRRAQRLSLAPAVWPGGGQLWIRF